MMAKKWGDTTKLSIPSGLAPKTQLMIDAFKRDCRERGGKVRRRKLKGGITSWTCSKPR